MVAAMRIQKSCLYQPIGLFQLLLLCYLLHHHNHQSKTTTGWAVHYQEKVLLPVHTSKKMQCFFLEKPDFFAKVLFILRSGCCWYMQCALYEDVIFWRLNKTFSEIAILHNMLYFLHQSSHIIPCAGGAKVWGGLYPVLGEVTVKKKILRKVQWPTPWKNSEVIYHQARSRAWFFQGAPLH